MQLANGEDVPEKVYLREPKWDALSNTFSGYVDWSQNPLDTGVTQVNNTLYTIQFTPDKKRIIGGNIIRILTKDNIKQTQEIGKDIIFREHLQ